jgi:calcineurin-like phosphoesterase family protein
MNYCNRPYETVEEMDETIISNWNKVVKSEDVVYHCGDFAFVKKPEDVERYIKRLNGQIHLIRGNHDKSKIYNKVKGFAWMSGKYQGKMVKINEYLIYCSHYAQLVWDKSHYGAFNAYGHSHGTLLDNPNSLSCDVGVDVWNYTPVSFDEFLSVMKKKNFKPVDYHGEQK